MVGEFNNIKIQGISACVPANMENVMDYASLLGEKRVKRQIKLTGIESRHLSLPGQKASDLGSMAVEEVLNRLNWDRESVRILAVVTQTPDFQLPATAMVIHKNCRLGKECMAFDINLGCSGYTAGLQIVSGMLQAGGGRALLVAGDVEAYPKERRETEEFKAEMADWALFGFGMTATALECCMENSLKFMQMSDGTGYKAIYKHHGHMTHMNGSEVFSFTINQVVDSIKEFKNHFAIDDSIVDYYVFHQAQKMILNNLSDLCDIPLEKILMSLKDYGNTSSASIPLTLCANMDKFKDKESIGIFMCGFGVGLSWGCIYTRISTKNIFPVKESDFCIVDEA